MATSTSTASASASIIPSPVLAFQSGMQPVTCEPLAVAWFYNGPESPINLIITNVGVAQDAPGPVLTSSSQSVDTYTNSRRAVPTGASKPILTVSTQIASDVDPLQYSYLWESVNVAAGWYKINASMPEYHYNMASSSIYVHQGNDTSCLASTSSSSSISGSPSSSSTSTSSPSSIVVPIGGSAHTSTATIVGVSIGAVILICMVLTGWLCMYRRGRKPGGPGGSNPWNGLGSVDSRMMLISSKSSNGGRHQSRNLSTGTIPVGPDDVAGAEKNIVYGKSGDPYGDLDGPGVALSAMPVLQHQTPTRKNGSRTYSASSSTSNVFSSNDHVPSSGPGRRPSVPDSILGRRSLDSTNAYPPVSPSSPQSRGANYYAPNVSRSPSISTNLTHQQNLSQSTSSHGGLLNQYPLPTASPHSDPSTPVSPSTNKDAAKDARRHSVGGRKRKPVPAYDPSQDPLSPSLPPSLAPSPIPPSSSTTPPSSTPEPTTSNGGGHYATRSQNGRDHSEHELVHKSSFGPGGVEGKPLHYLIPDMPMPTRE